MYKEQKRLQIVAPSTELVVDALKTLPATSEEINLFFWAFGIEPPRKDNEEDKERYKKECTERGVTPYTKMKFRYCYSSPAFGGDGKYQFRVEDFREPGEPISDFWYEGSNLAFKLGRIHRIAFEMENSGALNLFTAVHLDELVKNHYQPSMFSIALTGGDHGSCEYRSHRTDSSVSYYRGPLSLYIGSEDTPKDKATAFNEWFEDLAKRHNTQVTEVDRSKIY